MYCIGVVKSFPSTSHLNPPWMISLILLKKVNCKLIKRIIWKYNLLRSTPKCYHTATSLRDSISKLIPAHVPVIIIIVRSAELNEFNENSFHWGKTLLIVEFCTDTLFCRIYLMFCPVRLCVQRYPAIPPLPFVFSSVRTTSQPIRVRTSSRKVFFINSSNLQWLNQGGGDIYR